MYDPQLGRFLGEDPAGFAAGDANLYRYVRNSATNGTDPTGLSQAGNPLDSLAGGYGGGQGALREASYGFGDVFTATASVLGSAFGSTYSGYVGAARSIGSSVDFGHLGASALDTIGSVGPTIGQFVDYAQTNASLSTQFDTVSAQLDVLSGISFAHLHPRRRSTVAAPHARELNALRTQQLILGSQRAVNQQQAYAFAADTLFGIAPNEISSGAYRPLAIQSKGAAFAGGIGTGGKAVVNGGAGAAVGLVTIGFVDYAGPLEFSDYERAIGADAATSIARGSFELAGGAAAGLGTRLAGKAGRAFLAYDVAGNVITTGRGGYNLAEEGPTVGGVVEVGLGGIGLIGNASGFREAHIRNQIDAFIATAKQSPTSAAKAAGRYEIRVAGPTNYLVTVDGVTAEFDGFSYRHRAILEAKYSGDARSPYRPGSSAPDFLITAVTNKLANQAMRLSAIAASRNTPLKSVRYYTNSTEVANNIEGIVTSSGLRVKVVERR